MQKAVIYARYSSSSQREESIEGQLRECKAFAALHDITVIGEYIDRALTGKTDARPQFQQMIADSAKETFNIVIVYQLDRFSRNRYDSAMYKSKLKKNGVKVISAKENITDDPSGIILESVLEGMAEYYSVELAQKIVRGMTENALACKWLNGIPFGYKIDVDKHLIIDETRAPIVKRIFEMYAAGERPVDIINYLNSNHVKTTHGKEFKRWSLNHILRNQTYTGVYRWRDIVTPNGVPRIISDELFYKVQTLLKTNHKVRQANKSDTYILSSKLKCGSCGNVMTGTSGTNRSGTRYYYYQCQGNKRKTCDMSPIPRDKLDDAVIAETIRMLSTPGTIDFIADTVAALPSDGNEKIKRLTREISDVKIKLKNCVKAVESGLISATITKNIGEYERKLAVLEKDLSIEEILTDPFEVTSDHVKFFLQQMLKIENEDERRDVLISTFIRDIVCVKGEKDYTIKITYNYKENPSNALSDSGLKGSCNVDLVGQTQTRSFYCFYRNRK